MCIYYLCWERKRANERERGDVYVYVCMCMYVYDMCDMCVEWCVFNICVYLSTCLWGLHFPVHINTEFNFSHLPLLGSTLFLRQNLPLNMEFLISVSLAGYQASGIYSPPSLWHYRYAPTTFSWLLGDRDIGYHACAASNLAIKPSSQTALFSLKHQG